MTLLNSLALISAMFVLAISPGPGVFATISRAIVSGFRSASLLIFGIVIGDIIYLLLAIFGLNIIAKVLGEFFILVRYIGGLYLIYLGYKIWILSPSFNIEKCSISWKTNFFSGLLITLSNPKVIIFYLTFLPAFIDLKHLRTFDIMIIITLVSVTLAFVLLSYAYMASRAKEFVKSKKAIKRLNKVSGGVMMGAGSLLILKE
jgi:threonine/homoserine/homoserine lactone efflux protein